MLPYPRAHDVLIKALAAEETVVHQGAIAALGEIGDPRCVENILAFAQSEDWLTRQRLAEALGNLPHAKSIPALNYLSKDSNSNVATSAVFSRDRLLSNSDWQALL